MRPIFLCLLIVLIYDAYARARNNKLYVLKTNGVQPLTITATNVEVTSSLSALESRIAQLENSAFA